MEQEARPGLLPPVSEENDMTDDQEPQVADAEVAVDADDTSATVVGAIGDETGTQAAGASSI